METRLVMTRFIDCTMGLCSRVYVWFAKLFFAKFCEKKLAQRERGKVSLINNYLSSLHLVFSFYFSHSYSGVCY